MVHLTGKWSECVKSCPIAIYLGLLQPPISYMGVPFAGYLLIANSKYYQYLGLLHAEVLLRSQSRPVESHSGARGNILVSPQTFSQGPSGETFYIFFLNGTFWHISGRRWGPPNVVGPEVAFPLTPPSRWPGSKLHLVYKITPFIFGLKILIFARFLPWKVVVLSIWIQYYFLLRSPSWFSLSEMCISAMCHLSIVWILCCAGSYIGCEVR